MNAPVNRQATYADIEALPAHLVGELIGGQLLTRRVMPSIAAALARSGLGAVLGHHFQLGRCGKHDQWIVFDRPELHLGGDVLVPEIAGWQRARLNGLPERWDQVCRPDWVCEVLSPSTEKYDKGDKLRIYATYSVEHIWFVDPRVKSLEVFQRQDKDWLLKHAFFENDGVCAPPFDVLTFKLGLLWPFDPPTEPGTPT